MTTHPIGTLYKEVPILPGPVRSWHVKDKPHRLISTNKVIKTMGLKDPLRFIIVKEHIQGQALTTFTYDTP